MRANSARARPASNQWKACPATTKSTLPASSVVSSAVPATLVKRGRSPRSSSAAALISAFGSTPKTLLPFCRKRVLRMPVPDPTSATTESLARPHSLSRSPRTARG
jgi:hypothetical protein